METTDFGAFSTPTLWCSANICYSTVERRNYGKKISPPASKFLKDRGVGNLSYDCLTASYEFRVMIWLCQSWKHMQSYHNACECKLITREAFITLNLNYFPRIKHNLTPQSRFFFGTRGAKKKLGKKKTPFLWALPKPASFWKSLSKTFTLWYSANIVRSTVERRNYGKK